MIVYIPAHFEEEDYRPSWTGNYTYPTVTIRGIFDTSRKAEESIKNWAYQDEYIILIREIEEDEENNIKSFDIYYDNHCLEISCHNLGDYSLNEIVDEGFSAVCDSNNLLGFVDY